MDVDWSELPCDLVDNIAARLNDYVDYVRLRAVCWKWRSTLSPRPQYLATQFPWLMLRPEPESNYEERHGFFHILENKVYQLDLPNGRPWRRCCGSSHGWLVLLEERDPVIVLYNPLTRTQIQLPPLTTFASVMDFDIGKVGKEYHLYSSYYKCSSHVRDLLVKKIILSTSPDSDFVAMAIVDFGMQLAFCKKGEESWTMIENGLYYQDVIYYEGLFYAVHLNASVGIFDVSSPSPLLKVIKVPSPISRLDSSHGEGLYLVESFGELMMVYRLFQPVRVINNQYMMYETVGFKVVRLNSSKTKWVRVKSLGDRMLFLGSSASLSLLASDFNGCEGNRIYFTGESTRPDIDQSYCRHDSGIYNLENRTILELPHCPDQDSFFPPPVWLSPNPCSA